MPSPSFTLYESHGNLAVTVKKKSIKTIKDAMELEMQAKHNIYSICTIATRCMHVLGHSVTLMHFPSWRTKPSMQEQPGVQVPG